MTEPSRPDLSGALPRHPNAEIVPPGARPCPECGAAMAEERREGVRFDVCAAHGTWCDAGIIERAVNAVRRRERLKHAGDAESSFWKGFWGGGLLAWIPLTALVGRRRATKRWPFRRGRRRLRGGGATASAAVALDSLDCPICGTGMRYSGPGEPQICSEHGEWLPGEALDRVLDLARRRVRHASERASEEAFLRGALGTALWESVLARRR